MIRDGVRAELRALGVSDASLSTVAGPGCVHDGPMTTTQAARYCGFKTTAAIRKAYGEGRLVPLGKRGGKGTYVWSREALDAFLAGARGAIVPSGRPGAPPENTGGHHGIRRQVDHEMEGRNSAEAGETRRLAQKEGGFLVRGRAVDRRTGKLREIMRTVDRGDASGAYRFLQEELAKIQSGEG